MGKVQCELQLSIQETKGKQKHYYTFSHFVYELTRGRFGSVAECAIMISQLDPMIASCQQNQYNEKENNIIMATNITRKKYQKLMVTKVIDDKGENIKQQQKGKQIHKQQSTRLFQCSQCCRLITNQEPNKLLTSKQSNLICFKCILKQDNPENNLKPELQKYLQPLKSNRLLNFMKLKILQNDPFLLCLNSQGQFSLNLVIKSSKQLKQFMVRIDNKVLKDIQNEQFDFSSLDFVDITKKIGKNASPEMLIYLFQQIKLIPEPHYQLIGFSKTKDFQQLSQKIKKFQNMFKQFRQEKTIIKAIKFKVQNIKVTKEQWPVLDKICRVLVLGQDKQNTSLRLKYKKYKHLSLTNIKKLSISGVQITSIPKWLRQCYSLKVLQARDNRITQIKSEELPASIQYLNLYGNGLNSIDLSRLTQLNFLQVANNVLRQVNASQNNRLKKISVHFNQYLKEVSLPTSIQLLQSDKHSIMKTDFRYLQHLKQVNIWKGSAKREELLNLGSSVKLQNIKF